MAGRKLRRSQSRVPAVSLSRLLESASLLETERCGFTAKDLGIFDGWGVILDEGALMAKNISSFDEAQRHINTEFIPNRNNLAALEAYRA